MTSNSSTKGSWPGKRFQTCKQPNLTVDHVLCNRAHATKRVVDAPKMQALSHTEIKQLNTSSSSP
jgi:hypothetical protein